MQMTKKELASIAGYTYRRLHDIDLSLPENKKLFVQTGTNSQKCDLATFVQHWVDYNKKTVADDMDELSVIKAQHERVKKQKTEIEVSRMKGEFVELQAITRLWENVATTVRERFVTMPRKLAPSLVMQDNPDVIEEIIDREIRDALTMIANTPLQDDKQEGGEPE